MDPISALITGIAGLITGMTTTAMQIDAAEDQAKDQRRAANKMARRDSYFASMGSYTPKEVTAAPSAASIPQVGGGGYSQIDTNPFQIQSGSSLRSSAAERLKQRLRERRTV